MYWKLSPCLFQWVEKRSIQFVGVAPTDQHSAQKLVWKRETRYGNFSCIPAMSENLTLLLQTKDVWTREYTLPEASSCFCCLFLPPGCCWTCTRCSCSRQWRRARTSSARRCGTWSASSSTTPSSSSTRPSTSSSIASWETNSGEYVVQTCQKSQKDDRLRDPTL